MIATAGYHKKLPGGKFGEAGRRDRITKLSVFSAVLSCTVGYYRKLARNEVLRDYSRQVGLSEALLAIPWKSDVIIVVSPYHYQFRNDNHWGLCALLRRRFVGWRLFLRGFGDALGFASFPFRFRLALRFGWRGNEIQDALA